ncbi:MAG: DUF6494 family protein [Gammaproteobacteria bacterium]|nr:DUF6494 family protein [Gammaproteobacteria bacterium]
MNEDTFNMSVRKFLKKVGITSQRDIEKHVDEAIRLGDIKGNETFTAKILLEVPELGLKTEIDGKIQLE